jgi:nucleotide-binding universal stress UspA family protein
MLSTMGETIVVGYDGNGPAERALDRAIEEAKESGASLVVVVAEYMPVAPYDPSMVDVGLSGVYTPLPLPGAGSGPLPPVKAVMDKAADRLAAAGVSGECEWGVGDPARVIVDVAVDHSASKIMIGQDHHGFFGRLFGGDVEAEVKREADCEVVVVE